MSKTKKSTQSKAKLKPKPDEILAQLNLLDRLTYTERDAPEGDTFDPAEIGCYEILNFLKGPSNKNPPEALRGLSAKELRRMRRQYYSENISVQERDIITWYGTWPLLEKVINWCEENHFLMFMNKKDKRKWMRSHFIEKNKNLIGGPDYETKTYWHGTLETLIAFFIILEKSGAISYPHLQKWVSNTFNYEIRGEDRCINLYSLKAMWSTTKNSESGEGKKLTSTQRKSLKDILKDIKLAH